ncbi:MAG TPA: viral A-type inclusion protein [Chitinophagaceae bacterium]|nr:viral A-type inclusion protein [Chitinophagaceae bacterium]
MKKILFVIISLSALVLISCSSGDKKHDHSGHPTDEPKTAADSLYNDVMAGHDEVMPKMGKIRGAQKEAQRLIDSIKALPPKAQAVAASLKTKLEELLKELGYADFEMDKWMTEFNMDSAKENLEQRVRYLADEKLKVNKVKDAILKSLAKADSLLKK